MLLVRRTVAGHVKGRRARRMLGELMRPEVRVRRALVDPVLAHCVVRLARPWIERDGGGRTVVEHVKPAELEDPLVNGRSIPCRHGRAVGQNLGRRCGVVLPAQVAVGLVAAIA